MITTAKIDDLYNIAIDLLENEIDKKELEAHIGWYGRENFNNKDKIIMICSRLIEKLS